MSSPKDSMAYDPSPQENNASRPQFPLRMAIPGTAKEHPRGWKWAQLARAGKVRLNTHGLES